MKLPISIILHLILVQCALSATWLVRDGGNGTAPTTSWAGAYDEVSTAIAAAANYDTIYVAAGNYAGFNATKPITIKKATNGDHVLELGWSSAYHNQAVFNGGITIENSIITIDGQYGGGPNGWNGVYGFKILNGTWSAIYSTSGNPWGSAGYKTNVVIRHIECYGDSAAFVAGNATEVQIANGDMCHNWTISYVRLWNHGDNLLTIGGDNTIVEYSYIASHYATSDTGDHCENVWAGRGPSSSQDLSFCLKNVTFRYNLFTCSRCAGNLLFYGSGLKIYGNVFAHFGTDCSAPWWVSDGLITNEGRAAGNIQIYNNTFIDSNDPNTAGAIAEMDSRWGPNVARNNLFYNIKAAMHVTTSSHNHYALIRDSDQSFTNSTDTISGSDPFAASGGLAYDAWALASPGASGMALASEFATDMYGNSRSSGQYPWTRGAVQYGNSPPNTNQPVILTGDLVATNGFYYSVQVQATNASYFGATSLPNGLGISAGGVISGTPSAAITTVTTLFATNASETLWTNKVIQFAISNQSGGTLWFDPASVNYGWLETNSITDATITVSNAAGAGTLTGYITNAIAPCSIVQVGDARNFALTGTTTTNFTIRCQPTDVQTNYGTIDLITDGGAGQVVYWVGGYPVFSTTNWPLNEALIQAPFYTNADGSVSVTNNQPTPASGTAAIVWGWHAATSGEGTIWGLVDATNTSHNSVYFSVNGYPASPDDIWDVVPLATNYEPAYVHRRLAGTATAPASLTNSFAFGTSNVFILMGAEALTRIKELNIVPTYVETDVTPPIVAITSPTNSGGTITTSSSSLEGLSGTASEPDGALVSVVWTNSSNGIGGTCTGTDSWTNETAISLSIGNNPINVSAINTNSLRGTTNINVWRLGHSMVVTQYFATNFHLIGP